MASSLIHMVVASEVNKKINRDYRKLMIGTIAPDISKLIGEDKTKSHFLNGIDKDIPNLKMFLNKYKENLDDDFVLGYYIHLYTDYLWFKYFIPEILDTDKCIITKLDGTRVKCNQNSFSLYIYNDYTNLNMLLLDEYNLDLKIFYETIPKLDDIIEEIPMDKIDLIVNKAGNIIENASTRKELIFNLDNIKQFVKVSTEIILSNFDELNIN